MLLLRSSSVPYLDNIGVLAGGRVAVNAANSAASRHFWQSDIKNVKKWENGRFFAKKMPLLHRRGIDNLPDL